MKSLVHQIRDSVKRFRVRFKVRSQAFKPFGQSVSNAHFRVEGVQSSVHDGISEILQTCPSAGVAIIWIGRDMDLSLIHI